MRPEMALLSLLVSVSLFHARLDSFKRSFFLWGIRLRFDYGFRKRLAIGVLRERSRMWEMEIRLLFSAAVTVSDSVNGRPRVRTYLRLREECAAG